MASRRASYEKEHIRQILSLLLWRLCPELGGSDVEVSPLPIRLMQTPTICSGAQIITPGNQGLKEL